MKMKITVATSVALALFAMAGVVNAQQANMTFFVTSVGLGKGADLGGLDGADKHCASLAQAAGSSGKTWHAYLSTQGDGAVNARDRIGKGPWQNIKGTVIATSVDDLHSANNKLSKENNLSEKGEIIPGGGDTPNKHDILTGSTPDGKAFPAGKDMTCKNYTSSTEGSVMLGHNDRRGLSDTPEAKSWNSSHPSRGPQTNPTEGCAQASLKGTGGDGLLYCFAVN
jgi:hypothetical protein